MTRLGGHPCWVKVCCHSWCGDTLAVSMEFRNSKVKDSVDENTDGCNFSYWKCIMAGALLVENTGSRNLLLKIHNSAGLWTLSVALIPFDLHDRHGKPSKSTININIQRSTFNSKASVSVISNTIGWNSVCETQSKHRFSSRKQ
jgi:hypothetical protein